MSIAERPDFNGDQEEAREAQERFQQWQVEPEQLPTIFATSNDPYLEAQQKAAEKERQEGTVNEKPAITQSTEDEIRREERRSLEHLSERTLNRIRRALGGAGLRFA